MANTPTKALVGLMLLALPLAAMLQAGAAVRPAPGGKAALDPFHITTDSRAGYDWWALQPLRQPKPPLVKEAAWIKNPIDAFILQRLETKGLRPSPPADPRTLIRRLSFDLLGLPPNPEQIDAFLKDDAPDAYEKVVDRLLASPHYGERWARHWLDVVRFGESDGFEYDKRRPNAWHYRDWVVRALNADMPYDRFVRLQLAGDVLHPGDPSALTATGFLVAGAWDEVGQKQQSAAMKAVVRQDELEDMVSVIGQTFLGLTIHCARCHDHKVDPIRTAEYYQLTAALAGVRHGERPLASPQGQKPVKLGPPAPPSGRVYAVNSQVPEKTYLLVRGSTARKGREVAPGGVAAIQTLPSVFGVPPGASEGKRREALAAWITDERNPLFARVIVNRLWHHHFGVGLVDTPSDFGFNGGRPSHPELLDHLASELIHPLTLPSPPGGGEGRVRGWSLKAIHRLIVMSAAYRQASRFNGAAAKVDADNRLLWRKSPFRLEAEAVRDAILAVAGELNPTGGGPGYEDFVVKVVGVTQLFETVDKIGPSFQRRSLYRTWVRSGRNNLLDAFDCPDPSTNIPRRAITTTPAQALALLNSGFVLRMADALAARLQREAGKDTAAQVRHAYRLAYGRTAERDEIEVATRFVQRHGLAAFCRVIFNSNEFLYVD